MATLRIHRPWQLVGALYSGSAVMVIGVDGREVGRLRARGDLVTYIQPGRHHLQARQYGFRGAAVDLMLAPGEDLRLVTMYTGLLGNRISLYRSATGAPPTTQVLGVMEMHRTEEPIGTEYRRIDNTSGPARLTRTMRLTREWTRTVSLDLQSSRGVSAETRIGPAWLALGTTVEQSLSRTYAISDGRREEFAEELSIEVEPGTAVTVALTWKRLWQYGLVNVLYQGQQVEVPFCVAVGITFDQVVG